MTGEKMFRRQVLAGMTGVVFCAGGALADAKGDAKTDAANTDVVDIKDMKPGEFTWHPDVSPSGVVCIIVSLPEQRVFVYRNGIRIGVSTCSTGKKGHETPTGVFTILQKDKDHHSNIYNNASMPYMDRLTWSGVAMHAGHLPGYPASHGCIRLPLAFSKLLFGVTHIGTPVIVAGATSAPWSLTHPGLLLAGNAYSQMAGAVDQLKGKAASILDPNTNGYPATSFLASAADKMLYVFQDGKQIMQGALTVLGDGPLGEHVLMLDEKDGKLEWIGVTEFPDPTQPEKPEPDVIDRLEVSDEFRQSLVDLLHPGLTLIITDEPATADNRSDPGFVIMTSDDKGS